ncbi:hypothetical protein [Tahibacter harae]|uniref:DUF1444 family protein n=1 Tax=Tahibacter harae TaxID=2963937 RepID=A0ABT1QM78_9GAMM|nr:hypothetical protein [Tahibacter harae]MCQ4163618.1 hypothetical protein [Tahibacter harae]
MPSLLQWFEDWRRRRFARRLIAELAGAGMPGWRLDEAEDQLVHPSSLQVNLGNIRKEYHNAGFAQRRQLLRKYIAIARQLEVRPQKLWPLAAPRIYPVVRSAYLAALFELELRSTGKTPRAELSWPLAGDLCVQLVYDFGEHLSYVDRELAGTWGQSDAQLRETALANLATLPRASWVQRDDGVYQLASEASYEESLMLLPRVIAALPFADPVCIASNRGVLLAADGASPRAMLALIAAAAEARETLPWPLSFLPCRRRGEEWQALDAADPALPPPVGEALGNLRRQALIGCYASQKPLLDALHEHTGEDVFVANMQLLELREQPGQQQSWCVWTRGVPTLLPQTDLVALNRDADGAGNDFVLVSRDKLAPLLQQYGTTPPLLPPRVRVTGFPDDEQWQALQALRWNG